VTVAVHHTDAGAVLNTLEAISNDLAERQNEYEAAATDRARLIRDWERRLAAHTMSAKGHDAAARKAAALGAAIAQDDLYERLMDAEGRYEGCRAVIKVLETRSMIGMAILRSQGRS
jgi:hypothetical protein